MIEKPSRRDIADLRQFLDAGGYTATELRQRFGTAEPPQAGGVSRILYETRAMTPINTLVRLFLVGVTVEESAVRETMPGPLVDMCLHIGVLQKEDDSIAASMVIVPIEELLFASDSYQVLGGDGAAEFVLPAHTRATQFLRHMSLRTRVDRTLDLGCGCGVQALFAAGHSKQVVATDVNPRALRFADFNARLNNIENVECRLGNLFDPVADEDFDLILSNPPFVIGPSSEYVYRDNPMALDEFSRHIVRNAPARLREGGHLQMLCEWLTLSGNQWHTRLDEWFEAIGCDAWVLRGRPRSPADYVTMRLSDLSGGTLGQSAEFPAWLSYLEQNDVAAINAGMIVLRRRQGENWFHAHSITDEPTADAGQELVESLAAADFTDLCKDDDILLQARLGIAERAQLEQYFDRHAEGWDSATATLQLKGALPMQVEIDLPVLAFVNRIDGQRSLEECIHSFCEATGADPVRLTPSLLPVVRMLIRTGLLVPVDVDA